MLSQDTLGNDVRLNSGGDSVVQNPLDATASAAKRTDANELIWMQQSYAATQSKQEAIKILNDGDEHSAPTPREEEDDDGADAPVCNAGSRGREPAYDLDHMNNTGDTKGEQNYSFNGKNGI